MKSNKYKIDEKKLNKDCMVAQLPALAGFLIVPLILLLLSLFCA